MRYLYVSWLPLSFTAVCLLLGGVFLLPLAITGVFDWRSRCKEMKRLKGKQFSERMAHHLRRARCQRNMYIGLHGAKAREYYRSIGYKWWHILPDDLIENPKLFFSPRYLKATYFKI